MSVTWTSRHYLLFDSHSRDFDGKICPDGFSVLLKFSSQKSLEQHILETYFKDTNEEYVCLAVQDVKIEIPNTSNFDAKSSYMVDAENVRKNSEIEKEKCRKRKQTETEKEKCRERQQTETQKEKNRKRKQTDIEKEKSRERKVSKNLNSSRVSVFKKAITEGPYYICIVCHRCL